MPDGIGFKEGLQIEKEKWSNMNTKQRFSYFQTYYLKWVIIIVIVLVGIISMIASVVRNATTENLFEGAMVNTFISDEGQNYLISGYEEHLGATRKQKVYLNDAMTISMDLNDLDQYMYANRIKLMSLMAAQEIDYLILTEETFYNLEVGGTYADLREVLSKETLEAFADKIIYAHYDESDETYPAAICVDESYLAKELELLPLKDCYVAFVVNSTRLDRAEDFFEYIYWGE